MKLPVINGTSIETIEKKKIAIGNKTEASRSQQRSANREQRMEERSTDITNEANGSEKALFDDPFSRSVSLSPPHISSIQRAFKGICPKWLKRFPDWETLFQQPKRTFIRDSDSRLK